MAKFQQKWDSFESDNHFTISLASVARERLGGFGSRLYVDNGMPVI
jgi:hypothetical protein